MSKDESRRRKGRSSGRLGATGDSTTEGGADAPRRRRKVEGKPKGNSTWLIMEDIQEKLKLINYEEKFCKPHTIKPFPRTFFAMKGFNKSTQFAQFMKLVTWLFVESGRAEFQIDRFDDPTTSVNKVMLELKNMDFEMDYPVNQLLEGSGVAVCAVLNFLTDKALAETGFVWENAYEPKYPDEEFAQEAEVDEDADVGAIADDIESDSDEENGGEMMYADMVHGDVGDDAGDDHATALIEAEVDIIEWKKELERVGPKLKVKLVTHDKEWRSHLDQTKYHEKSIKKLVPPSLRQLTAIEASISNNLERVAQKERYINQNFEQKRKEYRETQNRLQEINQKYSTNNDELTELTNKLAILSDKLEQVQEEQEEKGSSMTNTGPLVRMKKAIQKLKEDRNQMELRIGVVAHTLMGAEMKNKAAADQEDVDSDEDLSD